MTIYLFCSLSAMPTTRASTVTTTIREWQPQRIRQQKRKRKNNVNTNHDNSQSFPFPFAFFFLFFFFSRLSTKFHSSRTQNRWVQFYLSLFSVFFTIANLTNVTIHILLLRLIFFLLDLSLSRVLAQLVRVTVTVHLISYPRQDDLNRSRFLKLIAWYWLESIFMRVDLPPTFR